MECLVFAEQLLSIRRYGRMGGEGMVGSAYTGVGGRRQEGCGFGRVGASRSKRHKCG